MLFRSVSQSRYVLLVFGVWLGLVGLKVGGKHIKEYKLWNGMIQRCFSEEYKQKYPTYEGVTCSKEWLSMTTFMEDVSQMKGYGLS